MLLLILISTAIMVGLTKFGSQAIAATARAFALRLAWSACKVDFHVLFQRVRSARNFQLGYGSLELLVAPDAAPRIRLTMKVDADTSFGVTLRHAGNACSLMSLATETLMEVAQYLQDVRSLKQFMLTCRRLAAIGEYVRYTNIRVSYDQGTSLMLALLSGTKNARAHCKTVRRLWFTGDLEAGKFYQLLLLTQLLCLLPNLTALWIDGVHLAQEDVIELLNRPGGISRQSIHPARCLASLKDCSANSSAYRLPRLTTLKISHCPVLYTIALYRPLTELEFGHVMEEEEFGRLVAAAEGSILGTSLRTLSIKVTYSLNLECAVPLMATAFPHLRSLSLDHPRLDVEECCPLISTFQLPTPSFPDLWYMLVNGGRPSLSLEDDRGCAHNSSMNKQVYLLFSAIEKNARFFDTLGFGRFA
ncbi:hypothetical protein NMY22_g19869 [Coprinellus aureogranulatus]|nr:hypothetical protein NMY22_g19869 [Coprinellus aureogranulatus]